MWNMVIRKYHICTSTHYNKIFFFCHFADQVTLIEEDRVFSCQSMIAVKVFQTLFDRPSGSLIFVLDQIRSQIRHICHRILLRIQSS